MRVHDAYAQIFAQTATRSAAERQTEKDVLLCRRPVDDIYDQWNDYDKDPD